MDQNTATQEKYNEEIQSGTVTASKPKFDWVALWVWILSLIISLVPIYILLIQHAIKNNGSIEPLFWFACFKEYDILWVFATVLLFSCVNQITRARKISKDDETTKNTIVVLVITGVVLFIIIEAIWIAFKFFLTDYQAWPIYVGLVLIALSLCIATPLQVNFILNEE